MALINIKIEGVPYQVEDGITILEAARQCGYEIPSLCNFNHGECNRGSCRVCLVEATGARGLVASCVYPVNEVYGIDDTYACKDRQRDGYPPRDCVNSPQTMEIVDGVVVTVDEKQHDENLDDESGLRSQSDDIVHYSDIEHYDHNAYHGEHIGYIVNQTCYSKSN